jgi:hypothetical protein
MEPLSRTERTEVIMSRIHRTSQNPATPKSSRHGVLGRSFAAVGAGALLVTAMVAAAPAEVAPDCTLTFEPAAVMAGADSTELRWQASAEIEAPDQVRFQEDSGLTGGLVEERPDRILVNAEEGNEGRWLVTLHQGDVALCTGTVQVTEEE